MFKKLWNRISNRRYCIRIHVFEEPEHYYLEPCTVVDQYVACEYRIGEFVFWTKKLLIERVPYACYIQNCILGYTGWKSSIPPYLWFNPPQIVQGWSGPTPRKEEEDGKGSSQDDDPVFFPS